MSIAILTDSGVDLNPDVMDARKIHLVKGWVHLGISLYKDLPTETVLEQMKQGQRFSTAQVDSGEVRLIFKQLLNEHHQVLLITTGGDFDEFFGNATEIAKEFNGLVTVVDSRSVSIGQGLQAIRASELAAQGRSMPEIVGTLQQVRSQVLHMVVLKSLQYMRLNQRISGTQAFMGKVLGVNPLLRVKDSKMSTIEQPRGFQVSLNRMKKHALEYGQQNPSARLAFAYAPGSEAELEDLRLTLLGSGLFQDMGAHAFGSAVAANTGPGALGICLEPAQ